MKCLVVAPGPSVPDHIACGYLTIAVNCAVQYAVADILIAWDCDWWDEYTDLWHPFHGLMLGSPRAAERHAPVHGLKTIQGRGLGRGSRLVAGSSGHIAIQYALKVASDVGLVGFDCRDVDGEQHKHGPHRGECYRETIPYGKMLEQHKWIAESMPDGKSVVNLTQGSAIDCYPFSTFDEWSR